MIFVRRDMAAYDAQWARMREMIEYGHIVTHQADVHFAEEFRGSEDEITAWLELAATAVVMAIKRSEGQVRP